ncbi:MAG: Fic family protein [Candidatus Curtissbacteria bacterium]|nr:Fic family protein [Candidatus Curtissbacteria bacterium]
MFQPKFSYTPKMINTLASIERLYGRLLGEKLVPSLALKLSQENQILATHHSTSIEGNPLTPRDVTNIILGDQIPTTKSETEVKNYFATLNKSFVLAKKRVPITIDLTEDLHAELMRGLIRDGAGKFRDGPVFVGHKTKVEIVVKHNPPFHSAAEIKGALDEVYDWTNEEDDLHPLIKAGVMHHEFAYIHPFFDGNGRLARILTAYFLLLKQYEVVRFFILDDYYDIDRQQYSDTLHTADSGDKTKWLEYFLEGIGYSLQAALARIEGFRRDSVDEVAGEKRVLVSAREEDVLQIIIDKKAVRTSDIQEVLDVTRQQAHALLASLVKKGLLKKFGKTKTSYYKLISPKKQEETSL